MRKGLRLREVKGAPQSVLEVAVPGELERIRGRLTKREFEAGLTLRRLWEQGALNPPGSSSCVAKLGMGGVAAEAVTDRRLEMHDRLKAAMRAMGVGADFTVDMVCHDCRPWSDDALRWVRAALGRLADHLGGNRRAA